jgi:hypothetical protein
MFTGKSVKPCSRVDKKVSPRKSRFRHIQSYQLIGQPSFGRTPKGLVMPFIDPDYQDGESYMHNSLKEKGEIRLTMAILMNAWDSINLASISVGPIRKNSHAGNILNEVSQWIEEGPSKWPFAFENVCHILGLDIPTTRKKFRDVLFTAYKQ